MTEIFPGHASADESDESTLPATSARYGAFTDAVVAIAMTLLILPLMEAVSEADTEKLSAWEYLYDNGSQIFSFLTSFVLIGMFWFMHHRIFRADTPHNARLAIVNLAWMATIVFLPLANAMVGALESSRTNFLVYMGTLSLSSWLMLLLTALQLRARREADLIVPNRSILATPMAMSILFPLALLIALIVPSLSYFPLFVMILTGMLRQLLVRLGVRDQDSSGDATAAA